MPILYEFALSPFVQKVKIALREKGIDFDQRNGFEPVYGAEFAQGNPRAEVPMLVDGDARIWDSTVILDYIEERWPDPPLMPAGPAARAATRLLEELADTRLEALNFCIAEVMTFPVGEDAAAEAVVAASRVEIARLHGELAARLGGADHFGGAEPNRADISLLPHLNASRVMKNGPDSGPLADWLNRMNKRPSVAATVGEIKGSLTEFKEQMSRVQRGEDKRQVRDHRLDWLVRAGVRRFWRSASKLTASASRTARHPFDYDALIHDVVKSRKLPFVALNGPTPCRSTWSDVHPKADIKAAVFDFWTCSFAH